MESNLEVEALDLGVGCLTSVVGSSLINPDLRVGAALGMFFIS